MRSWKRDMATLGVALIAVGVVAICGCKISVFDRGIPGSGIAATETRDVESFDALEFAGSGELKIVCGKEPSLEVTADDNLLEFIETKVESGVLRIGFTENVSPDTTPTFVITTGELHRVDLAGAATCEISDLDVDSFQMKMAGASKVSISGVAEEVELNLAGAGKVDSENLVARRVALDIAGSGSVVVQAIDSLDVSIAGSGSVKYYGDPEVSQSIMGAGSVSRVGDLKAESTSDHESEAEADDHADSHDEASSDQD